MKYGFGYDPEGPYGRAVGLLEGLARDGVVLDLGCGAAAICEPVRGLGVGYVGVDVDAGGVASLRARGVEAHEVDLRDADALPGALARVLGDRPLAALVALDAIEHVPNHLELLRALAAFGAARDAAPLVISIPNVTHLDLGVKLLSGRWDVTPTGLLDDTHVRFFGEDQLRRDLTATGWEEVARADFEQPVSDQHFPDDLSPLQATTALGGLLASVRKRAPAALTNQFVRAYRPTGTPAADLAAATSARPPDERQPLLSIITRTRGTRPEALEDLLTCLLGQTCPDFELLLVLHDVAGPARERVVSLVAGFPASFRDRVRTVDAAGGGRARPLNVGVEHARGRYVSIVDDDDLVLGNFVEVFAGLDGWAAGRLLRAVVAEHDIQDLGGLPIRSSSMRHPYPVTFDLVDHLYDNRTPCCALAFPTSAFRDLGVRFDEDLEVVEDWEVILQCALLLGVTDAYQTTSIYRRGAVDASHVDHDEDEWDAARERVRASIDTRHWVIGPGDLAPLRQVDALRREVAALWSLLGDAEERERERAAAFEALGAHAHGLAQERDALLASTSWRAARVLRVAGRVARRGRRELAQRLRT